MMPWQRRAADVIGEQLPGGRFAYPLVILSVPRQAGKTAMVQGVAIERMITAVPQQIWYTAQTGAKATQKFIELAEELLDPLAENPLAPMIDLKRGASDPHMKFGRSRFHAHPPTAESLHSNQSDLNLVDEAWSHSESSGAALMAAITPTQLTRPNPQTIILSAGGTADSVWWQGFVDNAPHMAGVALIDYGAPKGTDPEDIDTIAAHHPGVGYTSSRDGIAAARSQMTPGEFLRAYGNVPTSAAERILTEAHYTGLTATPPIVPPNARRVYGVGVAMDGADTAIWEVARAVDGRPAARMLAARPGTDWAAPFIRDLPPAPVMIATDGPGAVVAAALDRFANLKPIRGEAYATACGALHDRIANQSPQGLTVKPDDALRAAFAAATRRARGDKWIWSRRGGSITALEALTAAVWGITSLPGPSTDLPRMAFDD